MSVSGVIVQFSFLFLAAKSENLANCFGDHEFFVRPNDADCNPASRGGNHAVIHRISLFVEFDSKKPQPIANPAADRGRILSDAAREDQRIQSTQRRRECANPFLDLVAEQRDRFSRSHVLRLVLQQVAHIGTGLGYSEQPGLEIDHLIELLRAHVFRARQIPNQSGIEIAGTSAHRHPGRRREAHACVEGFALTHGRQARAIAEVGEDDPTFCRLRSATRASSSIRNAYDNP